MSYINQNFKKIIHNFYLILFNQADEASGENYYLNNSYL